MHALLLVLTLRFSQAYLADWALLGGRPTQPTCVDIPPNMTLCHRIGYGKMRLPNLLDHDSMAEVSQQSKAWVPLLGIKCHADTQLFLCSLFAPVCLDRPIYPCRSLCDNVRNGCEGRMKTYGYPWPEMLRCEKFPMDNDMCIAPQAGSTHTIVEETGTCKACSQEGTYENILDHFCRADFVVKTKIRRGPDGFIQAKKSKVYKLGSLGKTEANRPKFTVENGRRCDCTFLKSVEKGPFLIMGRRESQGGLVASFLLPWERKDRNFRIAVKKFKALNCTDPKMVSESMLKDQSGKEGRGRKKDRRKNNKQQNV